MMSPSPDSPADLADPGFPRPGTEAPTVQLRHDMPDGSSHVDWLIGRDDSGESRLLTFRLPAPLGDLDPARTHVIERIADHRPKYLTYEGAITGGRGEVDRIASGRAVWRRSEPRTARLITRWEGDDREIAVILMASEDDPRRWMLVFAGNPEENRSQ